MILADVFRNSHLSRDAELTTSSTDEPLFCQFAASNGKDAADAAELVAKYVNGVDINCGCPQAWAIQEGIGAHLSKNPDIVEDIISQVKRRTSSVKMDNRDSFPCSIKIRIDSDLKKTVELCQRAEKMGCDLITVHGRLRNQKNEGKPNLDAIKLVKEHVSIPVFGNGGVESLEQANQMVQATGVDGVMVAQGLLKNPAMFQTPLTPNSCVSDFVSQSINHGSCFFIFHHHLQYMLEDQMSRSERKYFNALPSTSAVLDYLYSTGILLEE